MAKSAQAALDFLMTYGWAIGAVITIITALTYFGFLDITQFLPNKCEISLGMKCEDLIITSDGKAAIRITNGVGRVIVVKNITFSGKNKNIQCRLTEPDTNISVENGYSYNFYLEDCGDVRPGQKVIGKLYLTYMDKETKFENSAYGEVITLTESSSITQPEQSPTAQEEVQEIILTNTITTFAGTGAECRISASNLCGDNGLAENAGLSFPYSVALDGFGNVYIAEVQNKRIRKVDSRGIVTTVAGGGSNSNDNIPATQARFQWLSKVYVDNSGDVLIADANDNKIRKVNSAGLITRVAGSGVRCPSSIDPCGDNGLATQAKLNSPKDIAEDSLGNIYIADSASHKIRKISLGGIITTVVGTGVVCPDSTSDCGNNGPAILAELNTPNAVAVDSEDNLIIADTYDYRIRKVDSSTGLITTMAGTGRGIFGVDNISATSSNLMPVWDIDIDDLDNIYFTSTGDYKIRKIDTSGMITTVAGNGLRGYTGDDGDPRSAKLSDNFGIALDKNDNNIIYATDSFNHVVRKITLG